MTKILIVDDLKGWCYYHSQMMIHIFESPDITVAESAKDGYEKLLENNDKPFDIIITDLQMETDFEPKYAGEWFIEQIKSFKNYYKTKVVLISASYNINVIAERLGVYYIRKSTARCFPDSYNFLKE